MFGQIIVNDKHVFSLIHKILCHGSSCIRCDVLQRSRITGSCCYDDGIIHGTVFFQCRYNFCNCRCFLSNCNINTDDIFALLVDHCIGCNGCLTCLTVTDDQLSLSTANREHGIDGKDSCLHWYANRFTINDTRCFIFNRPVIIFLNVTLTIDRCSQCIDDSSDKFISNRNSGFLFGSCYLGSFLDPCITAEQNDTDLISSDILYHTFYAVLKDNDLTIHGLVNSIDSGNSVTNPDDMTNFPILRFKIVIFDFFLQDGNNIL